jgi:hypothetical protein
VLGRSTSTPWHEADTHPHQRYQLAFFLRTQTRPVAIAALVDRPASTRRAPVPGRSYWTLNFPLASGASSGAARVSVGFDPCSALTPQLRSTGAEHAGAKRRCTEQSLSSQQLTSDLGLAEPEEAWRLLAVASTAGDASRAQPRLDAVEARCL